MVNFWKPETVLPDKSILIGQKWQKMPKLIHLKCDIFKEFLITVSTLFSYFAYVVSSMNYVFFRVDEFA